MGGDTRVVELDLADQASVRAFPTLIDGDRRHPDSTTPARSPNTDQTVDGRHDGTNFGPFALTNLMFPRVRSQITTPDPDAH